jgi:protein-S-isoprenylcysteine O-methyltransferase Ste14
MNLFSNIIAVLWIIFMIYWLTSAIGVKKNAQGGISRAKGVGGRLLLFGIVLVLLNLPSSQNFFGQHDFSFSGIVQLFGVIVCAFGVALAIWARRHLGRNWGMPMSLKVNAELVTTGPYEYIRNPIYTGFLMAMLGSSLVNGIFWLVIFIVFGLYFVYSSKVEEKIMLKEFPTQYPAYKSKTKMLIPFVF